MTVTTTPNVQEAMRADPILAMAIELLRRETRPGYLHLFRHERRGPFTAVWYPTGQPGDRRTAKSERLDVAILRVLEEAA